jgi:hypothetical protein
MLVAISMGVKAVRVSVIMMAVGGFCVDPSDGRRGTQ